MPDPVVFCPACEDVLPHAVLRSHTRSARAFVACRQCGTPQDILRTERRSFFKRKPVVGARACPICGSAMSAFQNGKTTWKCPNCTVQEEE